MFSCDSFLLSILSDQNILMNKGIYYISNPSLYFYYIVSYDSVMNVDSWYLESEVRLLLFDDSKLRKECHRREFKA